VVADRCRRRHRFGKSFVILAAVIAGFVLARLLHLKFANIA